MGYKRAEWKSGLTYKQTCEQCHAVVKYQDDKLDYRPWFADGFVYCPVCKKPLRHNEKYAVVDEDNKSEPINFNNEKRSFEDNYCRKCGKKYSDDDLYCPKCGNKRG